MLRKILCVVSFPVIVMPLLTVKTASAVAVSFDNHRQLSSQLVFTSVRKPLLLSSQYDEDRDDERECHHKYQEVYRNIERDREDFEEADGERDRRRYERKLDKDYRRLQDLRENYSNCDYHSSDRDNREYRDDHDYNDEPPPIQLPPRQFPPHPVE